MLARCLHVLLSFLITQQSFAFAVYEQHSSASTSATYAGLWSGLPDFAHGAQTDPALSDLPADPMESGGEEECTDKEPKEDKEMICMSMFLTTLSGLCMAFSEGVLTSLSIQGVLTPPPEHRLQEGQ